MRARIVPTLIVLGVVAGATACGGAEQTGSDESIVAAFYPVAFAAEQIAPDARVTNLTPAGVEPHDLELTARDIESIDAAKLVLYLGNRFMPALEDAAAGDERAIDLLDGESLLEGSNAHDHEGGYSEDEGEHAAEEEHRAEESKLDPHVWLDPMRYAAMAERIAEALGESDGADDLIVELGELDDEFRSGLAKCERRAIVTSHSAFGYLAKAYGLRQIALTGLSPEAEPSAKAIEALVEEVEEEDATTVFFETLVSADLAETVAREAGATTAVLNPLEGLTEGEIDAGADYFSVMRENLDALRTALGCS